MVVFSVIVCYNPNIQNLINLCSILQKNKVRVILVDNSDSSELLQYFDKDICFIEILNENVGIAKAQNIGISIALNNHADVVVFFDQDSEITSDFISVLLKPMQLNSPMVIGPVFYDKKTKFKFPNFELNRVGLLKVIQEKHQKRIFSVDVIISSGSAINKKAIEQVGLMNEDYFIDFVDIEWCLRCKSQNVPIFVNKDARMNHSIGELSINLFLIRLFIHSPFRTYYKIRNTFLFLSNKNVPMLLGLKEILSALLHNFLVIFFVKNKKEYAATYIKAILDGIQGKKGIRK